MTENTTPRCDRCNFCYRAKSKKYRNCYTDYCAFNNHDVGQSHFGKNSPKTCPLRSLETIIYAQEIIHNVILNNVDLFNFNDLVNRIKSVLFDNEQFRFFDDVIELRIFVATELLDLIKKQQIIETDNRQYHLAKQKETSKNNKLNIVIIERKRQLDSQTISKGFFGTTSIKHWAPEQPPTGYVTNLSHSEFSAQLKTQPFISLYDPSREEYITISTDTIANIRFKKYKNREHDSR